MACTAFFMKVGVFFRMHMRVDMRAAVGVDVDMFMRPVLPGSSHAPNKIHQPEGNQRPRGQIAAKGFDCRQSGNCDPQRDADQPQPDGACHMTRAAQQGNPEGFQHRPFPGLSHDNKREIVVGTQQGVKEA